MKLKELKNGWEDNGSFIPKDEGNNDYQAIKKYIAEGGEYEKFDWLADAKTQKITELNEFHASPEVKKLTIKAGTLEAHIGLDSDSRYLIDEQISLLNYRVGKGEVNPSWTYQNGVSVPLNLNQLIGLRLYIGSLTDYNYKARREAEKTINNLKTIDEIKNFDFKKNYKINQIIPLAL